MAKPVDDFKSRAFDKWGGSNIVGRGKTWLLQSKPDDPNIFMLDTSIGAVHYGPQADQEIDTAWVPDTGAGWAYKMVLADFNAFARSNLNSGTLVEYRNPVTDEAITFQPLAVNWVDVNGSRQQLAQPQAVAAVANDDLLRWPNGYGPGLDFEYITQTERLQKQLIIDTLASLPDVAGYMVGPINIEIEFIIGFSSGLDVFIDEVPWDKTNQVATANRIEFKDSLGVTQWFLDYPRATDSFGGSTIGQYTLRRQANNFYITVRIPKAWLDSATFPVKIDPTVTPLVGASSDDVGWATGGAGALTDTEIYLGSEVALDPPSRAGGYRFQLAIPNGASITLAYIELVHLYTNGTGSWPTRIRAHLTDNAPTWTTATQASQCTIYDDFPVVQNDDIASDFAISTSTHQPYGSPDGLLGANERDINQMIEQIVAISTWASGNYARFVIEAFNAATTFNATPFLTYDSSTTLAPRLHVEYTSSIDARPHTLQKKVLRHHNQNLIARLGL